MNDVAAPVSLPPASADEIEAAAAEVVRLFNAPDKQEVDELARVAARRVLEAAGVVPLPPEPPSAAQDLYDTLELVLDELGVYRNHGPVEKNAFEKGWDALARFAARPAVTNECPTRTVRTEHGMITEQWNGCAWERAAPGSLPAPPSDEDEPNETIVTLRLPESVYERVRKCAEDNAMSVKLVIRSAVLSWLGNEQVEHIEPGAAPK